MKNIYKVIGMFVLVLFALSCEEELVMYEGDAIVHFSAGNVGSFQAQENTDTYTIELGTTTSAAASVTLEIGAASTAIEGVHFQEFNKSVSIGAGEYNTTISINPIVENITPGSPVILVINIPNSNNSTNVNSEPNLPIFHTSIIPVNYKIIIYFCTTSFTHLHYYLLLLYLKKSQNFNY